MPQRARLFDSLVRAANKELSLIALDPEVRRIIGNVRDYSYEFSAGNAFAERAVEVRDDGNDEAGIAIGPKFREQPHLFRVVEADQDVHCRGELRRAESPALFERRIVNVLQPQAGNFAEDIQRVEEFLQVHHADLPRTPLARNDFAQRIGRAAVAAAGIEEDEIELRHEAFILAPYTGTRMRGFIVRRDHRLMRRVNRWYAPRWVRLGAMAATRAGDHWLWWSLGVLVFLFGGERRFEALAGMAIAAAAAVGLFQAVKRISGRKRPCEHEPHCWAKLLPPDQFSFPSGHTMTAFAEAVSLGLVYHDLIPFLLFLAISIGASRIILGMHFLSDVVVGALIGIGIAYGAVALI